TSSARTARDTLDLYAAFVYSSPRHVHFPAPSRRPSPSAPPWLAEESMPATLLIKPWHDPIVDTLGHDPRSRHVEQFWLPTPGPTGPPLLRHLADRVNRHPGGVRLPIVDTSPALGLGQREGSASPIVRTLRRLTQFDH